ncbi:hypothetical protein [Nocardia altamirensis]|uniref:hypothetical protein n=1 Tax=Nocardia altamirensis TaxID=472158 RepID=UPI00143555F0|nr:hypothetical protein [Nocardia altamirensis]
MNYKNTEMSDGAVIGEAHLKLARTVDNLTPAAFHGEIGFTESCPVTKRAKAAEAT